MEQTGRHRLFIELHAGEDPGDGEGVGQVGFARSSDLALVAVGGKDIRVAEEVFVQVRTIVLHAIEDVLNADLLRSGRRRQFSHPTILSPGSRKPPSVPVFVSVSVPDVMAITT